MGKKYLQISVFTKAVMMFIITLFFISGCTTTSTNTYTPTSSVKYTKPYYGDGYVFVIFNDKVENNKNDEWAKIVIDGFYFVSDYATKDDQLGVGIMYTDGSGSGYFVNNTYMEQYRNKEITAKEFVSHIKTKEFPLK